MAQTKKCVNCGISFDITDADLSFYGKVSPVFGGIKFDIPTPTHCPDCRLQRKVVRRNERSLYKRKCDLTGDPIVSIYSPDKPYVVYSQDAWRSDKWDPMDYGRDFDFSRPFFEQFDDLFKSVPRFCVQNMGQDNSEYCHQADYLKDSYLTFGSKDSENILYSNRVIRSDNVIDSSFVNDSSFIYQCVEITNGYDLKYCTKCQDCSNSKYLHNCNSCQNCFGCVNLDNKQYCIFNEQYTKDEYENKLKELSNYGLEKFNQFKLKFPSKYSNILNSENTTGDYIYNSKNVENSYIIYNCENIKYSHDLYNNTINAYDCFSGYGPADLSYECISFGVGAYHNLFLQGCHPVNKSMYSVNCFNVNNCFGCTGLRDKEYCIFNKQYTKEEYEKIVPKIIEHMIETGERGEFFPISICPFGYNETVANELFPITIESAKEKGYKWMEKEYPINMPEGIETINALDLPDISNITEDILNKAIICSSTNKPFRIVKQELDFYLKNNLPLPTEHPDVRYTKRMSIRNPRKLRDRKCDRCNIDLKTTFDPNRSETVYCDSCYDKEIYG